MRLFIQKNQKGFFTIGISLVVMATALITLGSANFMMNKAKSDIGNIVGTQVNTVTTALSSYVNANTDALKNNTPVAGVVDSYKPTIAELKTLKHLASIFKDSPTLGGSYVINIALSPVGCAASDCTPSGSVYLQDPVIGPSGLPSDIKLLSAAAIASSSGQVGFSSLPNTAIIKGSHWELPNPDVGQRPGIIYGTTSFAKLDDSSLKQKWWLESAENLTALNALAVADHVAGDVRVVKDVGKPYIWTGSIWRDLNSTSTDTFTAGKNSSKLGANGVYIGKNAGPKYEGATNLIAIGNEAGANSSFYSWAYNNWSNILIGYRAGKSMDGGLGNIYIGQDTGVISRSSYNIGMGHQSLERVVDGASNTSIGSFSGSFVQNGSNNTFLGLFSGLFGPQGSGTGIINGLNNTAIGANAGFSGDFTNATALGSGAYSTASHSVTIGNFQVQRIGGVVGWSNTSDRRLKTDIVKSYRGLDFVRKLQPVDYSLIKNNQKETGFIAQDVEAIDPSFPGINKPKNEEDYYSLTYTDFIPSIVKSIQELDVKVSSISAAHGSTQSAEFQQMKKLVIFLAFAVFALFVLVFWLFREVLSLKKSLAKPVPVM